MYDEHGTPTDLNLTMRGLLVAIVFTVLGALVVAHPTPWSALGGAVGDDHRQEQRTAVVAEPEDSRQA